jgi:hypothetical protein
MALLRVLGLLAAGCHTLTPPGGISGDGAGGRPAASAGIVQAAHHEPQAATAPPKSAPNHLPNSPLTLDQAIELAASHRPELTETDVQRGPGRRDPVTAKKDTDWQVVTAWIEVLTRVRAAYFDVLTIQAEAKVHEDGVRQCEKGLDEATQLALAGNATRADVVLAEAEVSRSKLRLAVAQERAAAAWKQLALAVGIPDMPVMPLSGSLKGAVPAYEWHPAADTMLARSSVLQEARARKHPEVREIEILLQQRLTTAFQRYYSARQQAETYEKEILPRAEESLRLVEAGVNAGDARCDYAALLRAQNNAMQARLTHVQALGEWWRAAVEIAGLVQD